MKSFTHNPKSIISILIIALILMFSGCSGSKSPIIPADNTNDMLPSISSGGDPAVSNGHCLQGIWQMNVDLETQTVTLVPSKNADFHMNVVSLIAPLWIYFRSWDGTNQIVDVDVAIRNSSLYNGYDVRLIVLVDNIGHKLMNPDNYTHLWDIPEGTYSNGFKAYAKDDPNRILHAGELKTENLLVKCPGANFNVQIAIDASWPGHCEEPYLINNFSQGELRAYSSAECEISMDVFDWQNNANSVRIQCSAITSQPDVYLTHTTENTWTGTLVNDRPAQPGIYKGLIIAMSENDPITQMLDVVDIEVIPAAEGFAVAWGGEDYEEGDAVTVTDSGDIYVTGNFHGTVDFNPDPDEEDIKSALDKYKCGFLMKLDPLGDYLWTVLISDGYVIQPSAIDHDANNRIIVGGYATEGGVYTGFLKIFNQNGTQIDNWAYSSSGRIQPNALEVDYLGNLIIGGTFEDSVDFNPDGTDIHTSTGGCDCFLSKLDSNYNYQWTATWGTAERDELFGVATSLGPAIYACGRQGDTPDAFLTKLNGSGVIQWNQVWGDWGYDIAYDCVVDQVGYIYTCGSFAKTVDFDPSPTGSEIRTGIENDSFISKFHTNGQFQWVIAIIDSGNGHATSIIVDESNNLLTSGECSTADFDPGPGSVIASGGYIAKYSTDQAIQWVTGNDYRIFGLCSDSLNNCYATGYFAASSLDFDPGLGSYILTSSGHDDCFLMKVLENGFWE